MDKEVLQLVDRDTIEAYRQGGETVHLTRSQEKEVFEPSATVHGRELNASYQGRLDILVSSTTGGIL